MAASVQILCPNGRRQIVKVTPNTKFLQVLEEVCTKQGFLPSEDYDLIHGRKTLDLTLAFRYSNLSNNAKLELVKATSPRGQSQGEVTIALQLEGGERLQHPFPCSTSLWDILQHWERQDPKYKDQLTLVDGSCSPPIHPVCIYMREEVVGEAALRYTTLKKLALTSGKAIIRLVHRPVEDGILAEVVNKIEREKAKDARLAQKAQGAERSGSVGAVSASVSEQSTPVDRSVSDQFSSNPTAATEEMEVDKPKGQDRSPEKKDRARKPSDPEPMDTGEKPKTPEAHSKPGAPQHRSASSVDQPTAGASASGSSPLEQLRNIPGLDVVTPQDFLDLTPEEQQVARRLMQEFVPALVGQQLQQHQNIPRPQKPTATLPPAQQFTEFKFPEETKGQNLYRNELSDVKTEEYKACDRETVIYNSNEENTSKALSEEPTEDFFEVTEADVRSLYKDRQKQATCERQLMTESMRQLELDERHQQYSHVVVRVQFPDGLVLQGCFRPRETVFALHKFVKEHLEDKSQDFHLYKTPPKQVLTDMSKTLVQADLAPATLVYFSSKKQEEHSLCGSARDEVCSKRRADELSVKKLAKKQMESVASGTAHIPSAAPSSPPNTGAGSHPTRDTASSRPSRKTPASGASSEAKMPKWLKIGKK